MKLEKNNILLLIFSFMITLGCMNFGSCTSTEEAKDVIVAADSTAAPITDSVLSKDTLKVSNDTTK